MAHLLSQASIKRGGSKSVIQSADSLVGRKIARAALGRFYELLRAGSPAASKVLVFVQLNLTTFKVQLCDHQIVAKYPVFQTTC